MKWFFFLSVSWSISVRWGNSSWTNKPTQTADKKNPSKVVLLGTSAIWQGSILLLCCRLPRRAFYRMHLCRCIPTTAGCYELGEFSSTICLFHFGVVQSPFHMNDGLWWKSGRWTCRIASKWQNDCRLTATELMISFCFHWFLLCECITTAYIIYLFFFNREEMSVVEWFVKKGSEAGVMI